MEAQLDGGVVYLICYLLNLFKRSFSEMYSCMYVCIYCAWDLDQSHDNMGNSPCPRQGDLPLPPISVSLGWSALGVKMTMNCSVEVCWVCFMTCASSNVAEIKYAVTVTVTVTITSIQRIVRIKIR